MKHNQTKKSLQHIALATAALSLLSLSGPAVLHSSPTSASTGNAMTATTKANRLLQEKSPYLLQHAYNPVDWYPWTDEAFARAKKEDKPIFLSIGYSTCHWCHVMAHESFENEEIAALLNNWFICIKVDREERPDIDQMYMAATQAMNGSGGWPMSLFLFPDGRPFWAATYIPPAAAQGRPGFPDIINAVHTAWTGRRNELEQAAAGLINALQAEKKSTAPVQENAAAAAFSSLAASYDSKYGGFGRAPKFPRPVIYSFLFRYWLTTGNKQARDMALATLKAMARGGMYDQLGGGFHRYSVDNQWRVPHFEKMLYDQAQLANAYLDAFQVSGDDQYAAIASQIFTYVLRDMGDPAGGFYSAEDADSDDPYEPGKHGEGAWYLWREEDIVKTVGRADATIFTFCYGVEFYGNALSDPQNEFPDRNILYLKNTPLEAAQHFAKEVAEIGETLARVKEKLFNKRQLRKRPHLDDKVLTAWNGLMISALARGGAILGQPELTNAARTAATFIREKLYNPTDKTLMRRYRQGDSGLGGQLDDYAFLVAGLLDLYEVLQEPQWLQWAIELTKTQNRLFWDAKGDGFFDSLADPRIGVRMKGDYDGAEPAANSIAAANLVRLARLTDNKEWLQLAEKTINSFSSQLNSYPMALVRLLEAQQELQEKPRQVVIAGRPGAEDTEEMLQTVFSSYNPGQTLLLADNGDNQQFLSNFLPFIRTVAMQDNKATAYICRDYTCQLPITDPALLAEELASGL